MPSTRTLKNKIKFTKNVQKITRAVEAISAVKLREEEKLLKASKVYLANLEDLFSEFAYQEPSYYLPNFSTAACILLVAPDKGFVGPLVLKLKKKLKVFLSENSFSKVYTITVHRASLKIIKNGELSPLFHFPLLEKGADLTRVYPIFKVINDYYLKAVFGKVFVLYAEYNNFFSQEAVVERLLPFDSDHFKSGSSSGAVIEPSGESFVRNSSELYLKTRILTALLNSNVSEHAVRLVSMKKAHDNAKEVMKDAIMGYNKKRQFMITSEILSSRN
ncbi:MAG: F0F1 ATP synthase subunit gamma [Patescibacteria group bacterium]